MAEVAVPGPDGAARHDYEALRIEPVSFTRPAHHRNPIEQLISDLRCPRTDDDRLVALGNSGKRLVGDADEVLELGFGLGRGVTARLQITRKARALDAAMNGAVRAHQDIAAKNPCGRREQAPQKWR